MFPSHTSCMSESVFIPRSIAAMTRRCCKRCFKRCFLKLKQELKINFFLYQSQPCCDLESYMLRWSSCGNFICTVRLFQSIFVERWDGNAFVSLPFRLHSGLIWRLNYSFVAEAWLWRWLERSFAWISGCIDVQCCSVSIFKYLEFQVLKFRLDKLFCSWYTFVSAESSVPAVSGSYSYQEFGTLHQGMQSEVDYVLLIQQLPLTHLRLPHYSPLQAISNKGTIAGNLQQPLMELPPSQLCATVKYR